MTHISPDVAFANISPDVAFAKLLALFLIGGVFVAIVVAIAKNKPGLILLTGGLLVAMMIALLFVGFFGFRTIPSPMPSSASVQISGGPTGSI